MKYFTLIAVLLVSFNANAQTDAEAKEFCVNWGSFAGTVLVYRLEGSSKAEVLSLANRPFADASKERRIIDQAYDLPAIGMDETAKEYVDAFADPIYYECYSEFVGYEITGPDYIGDNYVVDMIAGIGVLVGMGLFGVLPGIVAYKRKLHKCRPVIAYIVWGLCIFTLALWISATIAWQIHGVEPSKAGEAVSYYFCGSWLLSLILSAWRKPKA